MKVLDRFTIVFGKRGKGKSTLLQHILEDYEVTENHLVYDTAQEYQRFNRYVPDNRRGDRGKAELAGVMERLVTDNRRDRRPDLFVISEINRFAPNSGKTPDVLLDVTDLARHYGVGVIGDVRRPAQLDTDVRELADNHVWFQLSGKNDKNAADAELDGLGDLLPQLPQYHFVALEDGEPTFYEPVPQKDTTGKL